MTSIVVCVGVASGQFSTFGKNKVQTRDYQFRNYETEHFKVLYYPGGEALAEFAARAAEDHYRAISRDLQIELETKTPLLVYLSPGQFSETNVVTDLIEEGVGGFSELLKNRIVIPFNGSYSDLYHVIGHELAHVFEFKMFYRSRLASLLGAIGEFEVPLWIMEGFAEYQSGWANVSHETFMRDLMISGRLVPLDELNDTYGYLAYREGEAFFRYVDAKYGREKVYEFMHSLKSRRGLNAVFNQVFGMSQERFGREWEAWLKMRYWPQAVGLGRFDQICRRLTDHVKDGSVYNTAPAISPSGTQVAMISDRFEYVDCYLVSALDGEVKRRLVRGGRSGGFEGMHLLRPGLAWSPDEDMLALTTTAGGRDNVTLIDSRSGRVRRRIRGNLDAVYSPKFSPDGGRLVFVGVKNGFSDIYSVGVLGGEPERLTYDMYDDRDPVFSPGGDTVVFVSDRPDVGEAWVPGSYALWLRDKEGKLSRLTEPAGFVGYPVFSSGGDYLLYAAADSAQNIYVLSLSSGRVVKRTSFIGEVSHLSLSRDDRKLAFAYYSNVGWDIALMSDPLDKIPADTNSPAGYGFDTVAFEKTGLDFDKVKPVGFSLSLDYAAGAASYSPGAASGVSGTAHLRFSDILGNHQFGVYTDLYGDILNSNAILQYWLLPYRIDWGFTAFQLLDVPYYRPGAHLVQRVDRGLQVAASYPFDKFVRVEAMLTGYASEVAQLGYHGGWYLDTLYQQGVSYGAGAFVFDNTFWDSHGPARGVRMRLEASASMLSDRLFQQGYADVRNYLRLGRRFVLASMLQTAVGLGRDRDLFYLGGENVRGYDYGEFYDQPGPGVGVGSLELRYPFIDRLKLAFPLPLDIKGIRGVAFLDAGLVVRDGIRIWDSSNRRLDDLKLGVGAGVRIQLSVFYLKFDFGKPLSTTYDDGWKFIFGLGTDF